MPDSNRPVIFLAFANDRDDSVGYLRNLPDEKRRLREVLRSAEQAGLCEVVVRSNSTADDIFKVFQDPKYRNRIAIFHYGGHANGYELLLESAEGKSEAANAGGLALFLAQQQRLQLAFLNGCSTEQQTQGLLDANISTVITTSCAVNDEVATEFACRFYQGLAGGASLRRAYNESEAAMQMAKGGNMRSLYLANEEGEKLRVGVDRWPWSLYVRDGAKLACEWNLPNAVNDPLFGLPALAERDLPDSPYRNLNWFGRKDAEVFFGRGRSIRGLFQRLTEPKSAPIMLFYGQSGVGKSSILDAGLLPRLEQDYEVRYLRRGEGGLTDTLELAFLPEAFEAPRETAWQVKEEKIGKPLIVFLDQVEELFTQPIPEHPDELDDFLKLVQSIFVNTDKRPQGKLVLGFRKEWLAELEAEFAHFKLPRTNFFLEPLNRHGIIEVVQGPAKTKRLREHYGLEIEEGLPVLIADDLLADRDSAIAPTLQILLTKMWKRAKSENYEKPKFTKELYLHLKRDGILLRDFLNQQISAFRNRFPEAVDSGLLLDIVALHTTPLGTADQQSIQELQKQYAHLGVTLPELLQECQNLHLLTVSRGGTDESKSTRLAHDTLAPLVREQFELSNKPGQRARRILDNRSVDWSGEAQGAPLDEADLTIVEEGVKATRVLNPTEQRLLDSSRQLRAKLRRARTLLKVGGVIVAVIIVALGVWGWGKAVLAEKKTKEAEQHAHSAMESERLAVASKILAEQHAKEAIASKRLAERHAKAAIESERLALESKELAEQKTEEAEKNRLEAIKHENDAVKLKNDAIVSAYRSQLLIAEAEREKHENSHKAIHHLSEAAYLAGEMFKDEDKKLGGQTQESLLQKATIAVQYMLHGAELTYLFQAGEPKKSATDESLGWSIAVSPLGKRFLIWDARTAWILDTESEMDFRETPSEFQQGGISDDGKQFFGVTAHGELILYQRNSETGEYAPQTLKVNSEVKGAKFAPNSTTLLAFTKSKVVKFKDGNFEDIYETSPGGKILDCSFTDDEQVIVVSSQSPQKSQVGNKNSHAKIAWFPTRDNTPAKVVPGQFTKAKISPDGTSVALRQSEFFSDSFKRIDLPNGTVTELETDEHLWLESGRVRLVNDSGHITIRDANRKQLLAPPITQEGGISFFAISDTGEVLVTSNPKGDIGVWKIDTKSRNFSKVRATSEPDANSFQPLTNDEVLTKFGFSDFPSATSYSGSCAKSDKQMVVIKDSTEAVVWDFKTESVVTKGMRHICADGKPAISGARFVASDSMILTWLDRVGYFEPESGQLRLWDAATGTPISPVFYLDEPVLEASFHPTEGIIARTKTKRYIYHLPRQEMPVNPKDYAEIVTGTRLNKFGELEFLELLEWHGKKP